VESRGRDLKLGAEQLLEQRQLHSVPVLKQMEALLLANLHSVLPGSLLGKALHYLTDVTQPPETAEAGHRRREMR
jgi:hypothetical protein